MGGKSTLMRQVCIATVMAQVGCYVPAVSWESSAFDRVYTRIGANDNIMGGQSTFMVELQETATVLESATPQSLVILDELGRGTSTFDGYALAYAVLMHLTQRNCLCLFSTHYHLLTREVEQNPRVSLYHMQCYVDDERQQVTYLYKFAEGACPKSYGMHVARTAGVMEQVVRRAERIANFFEADPHFSKLSDMYVRNDTCFIF
eukprot:TRINITY_DN3140_c0_g1_i2.p1 TRINITY_DN3140_c0_g1~~TRINITY_DN3140_c0_g1_i2.p1  ORF type:complete len:204 (+),score=27.81 TRINITY_DN3140_c0_g1_i2:274-885(+)